MLIVPWPTGVPATRGTPTAAVDGDRATVTVDLSIPLPGTLVLLRDAEGRWGIDLMESAAAGAASDEERELATGMLGVMSGASGMAPGGEGLDAYGSYEALYRLQEALTEYAADHDGCLPPADRWVDEIELYVLDRAAFGSPGAPELPYGFAMNVEASGRKYGGEDMGPPTEEFLVLFDWPGGERNATATPEQLAQTTSFWPDGSVGFLSSTGEIDALPRGTTLEAQRAAEAAEEAAATVEEGPGPHLYQCSANLELLAMAARRYARDHGGLLPAAATWQDDLAPYVLLVQEGDWWGGDEAEEPDPFHCPAASELQFGYAINAAVAGRNALDLSDQDTLVLFFETDLNVANAAGDPQRDACNPPRHRTGEGDEADSAFNTVAFVTGETSWQSDPEDEAQPEGEG
jgi:hypothetical protein